MSSPTLRIAISAFVTRSVAIAALLGAAFLADPLSAMPADGTTIAAADPAQAAFQQTTAKATDVQRVTVERWITGLHAALAITPGEETMWNSIAQVMRANPVVVQELAAGKTLQVPKRMIFAFETLYNAMPDGQKEVALQLFQSLGRGGSTASYCECVSPNRW